MKLELRIEGDRPAVFWTDCPDTNPGRVLCFTLHDGHNEASRAYMRSLHKPLSRTELTAASRTLHAFTQGLLMG